MRTFLVTLSSTLVALAGFAAGAQAAVPQTLSFPAVRAPHALALDPSLADPAWQAGKVPSDGTWEDVTTRAGAPDATTVYLLYDDRNLYIGFVARQRSPIVATQTTNDIGFGTDDFVGAGIDTSGAGSQAYFFETTPRGTRYEQASENARYRPDWRVATATGEGVWRAVMIVPLDVMHLRSGTQTWRVGFFRAVATTAEHYSWFWNPLMGDFPAGNWPSFNDLRFWPSVTGITLTHATAARPKPRLELYGLDSSGLDRGDFEQANGTFAAQRARSFGADLSVPITPTITFVGTANPDFSNVEIDQQTIAPQEFARQLIEYRPFFSQGAQYLDPNPLGYSNLISPQNEVFYSPSIGPFDSGAKVEGTYGLQSFGLLTFHGYNVLNGDSFDDEAFGWKHALQNQDFQYYVDGVLAHHSVEGDDDTIEGGFKGRDDRTGFVYGFSGDVEHGSYVPGNATTHSLYGVVDEHKPNYEVLIGYTDTSPNYNPIDGYTSNSDIHGFQGFANFVGSTPGIKTWDFNVVGDRFLDRDGAVHEADAGAYLTATLRDGLSLNGVGPTTSLLREYAVPSGPNCGGPIVGYSFFTGFPCYLDGSDVPFNLMSIPLGWHDGSPHPLDVSANYGSFDGNWLHYYTSSTSRPLGTRFTLGLEYDGTYERSFATGILSSQWLRRVSLGFDLNAMTNVSVSLRGINGLGGFVTVPGNNLAFGLQTRTSGGDLYVNYGSPSANVMLYRLIVKYVFRAGSNAGT